LRGHVRDQQNAIAPGSSVTVRNIDTNAIRTAVTDEGGEYLVTNLPVRLEFPILSLNPGLRQCCVAPDV
jgi:hypothetical protein